MRFSFFFEGADARGKKGLNRSVVRLFHSPAPTRKQLSWTSKHPAKISRSTRKLIFWWTVNSCRAAAKHLQTPRPDKGWAVDFHVECHDQTSKMRDWLWYHQASEVFWYCYGKFELRECNGIVHMPCLFALADPKKRLRAGSASHTTFMKHIWLLSPSWSNNTTADRGT